MFRSIRARIIAATVGCLIAALLLNTVINFQVTRQDNQQSQRDMLATEGIATALKSLDERSRRIVTERWLNVNDDGSGGMTLHELAAEYGVSAERIRQIEVAAMKKMKAALAEYA